MPERMVYGWTFCFRTEIESHTSEAIKRALLDFVGDTGRENSFFGIIAWLYVLAISTMGACMQHDTRDDARTHKVNVNKRKVAETEIRFSRWAHLSVISFLAISLVAISSRSFQCRLWFMIMIMTEPMQNVRRSTIYCTPWIFHLLRLRSVGVISTFFPDFKTGGWFCRVDTKYTRNNLQHKLF